MLKIARKIFFIFLATLSPLASLDNPSRTTKHLPVFAAQMPIVLLLALRADDLERLFVQVLLVSIFVLLAAARQTTCIDFECVRYAVGITPRPGLVACGDGRGVSADPIRISAAQMRI